jgi:serine/threonine protein kinase
MTAAAVVLAEADMLQADDIITLATGNYRLRAPLAGSAYGVVWRAGAPDGEPDVALKLINRQQMDRAQPALQARWVASASREIDFLRSLEPWDERHIVRLLDSGAHDGLPVMALELMESDLARHVAENTPSTAQVLDWIGQVNQALAKVHQYGWLYLDLKPSNVLLTSTGAAKLADFGTNRPRASQPADTYAGTASWQAPEQFFPTAQQHYDLDQRSDYFALGAMFYFLMTGGVPLRFCAECGQAYREHQADAPSVLLQRHGGAIASTLHEDEAALFLRRFGGQDAEATWCPAEASRAAEAALALLRTLLAPERAGRPRHALQISRMLAAIRRSLA